MSCLRDAVPPASGDVRSSKWWHRRNRRRRRRSERQRMWEKRRQTASRKIKRPISPLDICIHTYIKRQLGKLRASCFSASPVFIIFFFPRLAHFPSALSSVDFLIRSGGNVRRCTSSPVCINTAELSFTWRNTNLDNCRSECERIGRRRSSLGTLPPPSMPPATNWNVRNIVARNYSLASWRGAISRRCFPIDRLLFPQLRPPPSISSHPLLNIYIKKYM